MNKEEIIKIVRDLIDTPGYSEDLIDVCDKGENLIKLLQTKQLVLNGVSNITSFKCCNDCDMKKMDSQNTDCDGDYEDCTITYCNNCKQTISIDF